MSATRWVSAHPWLTAALSLTIGYTGLVGVTNLDTSAAAASPSPSPSASASASGPSCGQANVAYRTSVRAATTKAQWQDAMDALDAVDEAMRASDHWDTCDQTDRTAAVEQRVHDRWCARYDRAQVRAYRKVRNADQFDQVAWSTLRLLPPDPWSNCDRSPRWDKAYDRALYRAYTVPTRRETNRLNRELRENRQSESSGDSHVSVRACVGHILRVCVG